MILLPRSGGPEINKDGWLMRLGDFKLNTLEHLEKKQLTEYN